MRNEEIKKLIECSKRITKAPKRTPKVVNSNLENNFLLTDIETESVNFSVRIRQSGKFVENFSIMLDYYSQELNSVVKLVRYNGCHGIHANRVIDKNAFEKNHIHIATSEAIDAGLTAEHYAIEANYITFEDAFILFWENVKIIDNIETYFADIKNKQGNIFKTNVIDFRRHKK